MSSGGARATDDVVPMNPFQRSDAPSAPSQSAEPFPAICNPVFTPRADDAETNEPWYSRSPKLFTIMGIDVHVSPLLYTYIVFTLVLAAFSASFFLFALQAFASVLLFFTVLVHELGHCAAARAVGGQVSHILLWPLGGLAYVNVDATDAKGDFFVSFAGPLTHAPMLAGWVASFALATGSTDIREWPRDNFVGALAYEGCWLNIFLFLFNVCIPAYPLDGCRMLMALLAMCSVSLTTTATTIICLSTVMSLGVIAYGFWLVQFMPVFVGAFTLAETYKLYTLLKSGALEEHPSFAKYNAMSGRRNTNTSWNVQAV